MASVNPTGKHRPKKRRHGQGTIVTRRDARGRVSYRIVVPLPPDESGRRRRMWLSTTSREEAEALRADLAKKLARRERRPVKLATVADQLDAWLDEKRDQLTPGAYDRYRSHVETRLRPSLGDHLLVTLDRKDIVAASRRWTGAPATISASLTALRGALALAERDGLIDGNPARFVKPPRAETHQPSPIDVDDARRLLEMARGDRLEALLVVLLCLGLRRGEALGLRWSDVDGDTLHIRHGLRRLPKDYRTHDNEYTRLVDPKHRSHRTLPLPSFVAAALAEHRARQDQEIRAAKVWAANDFVFCRPTGEAIPFTSLALWFDRLVAAAGLPDMRLHDLRHSTGTILLALDVLEPVVQAILGHATAEQTRQYMKVLPRVGREAVERLAAVLG